MARDSGLLAQDRRERSQHASRPFRLQTGLSTRCQQSFPGATADPVTHRRRRPRFGSAGASSAPATAALGLPRTGVRPRRDALLDERRASPRSTCRFAATTQGRVRSQPCENCDRRRFRRRSAGTDATVLVGGRTAENVDYFDSVSKPAAVRLRVRARADARPADARLPLDRHRRDGDRAQPALGRRRLRPARPRLPARASATGCSVSSSVDAIEAWVPLFLFSVLFGLSMDYQVFLLSRIKERYDADRRHDGRGRVRRRRRPRGIITGAALIIVAVFARLRRGRPRHVPADGLRRRGRAADRRDDHPLGAPAGRDARCSARWNWYLPTGWTGCRASRSSAPLRRISAFALASTAGSRFPREPRFVDARPARLRLRRAKPASARNNLQRQSGPCNPEHA